MNRQQEIKFIKRMVNNSFPGGAEIRTTDSHEQIVNKTMFNEGVKAVIDLLEQLDNNVYSAETIANVIKNN